MNKKGTSFLGSGWRKFGVTFRVSEREGMGELRATWARWNTKLIVRCYFDKVFGKNALN